MSDERTGWGVPPGIPALPTDEVHVWRAAISQWSDSCEALAAVLSPAERETAARFHFADDRTRSIVARGFLRRLLARASGTAADALLFTESTSGKPSLAGSNAARLEFNVSHSGDLVLIAIAIGRAVGVDVEQIRPGSVTEQVPRYFSAREQAALAGLQPPMLQDAFFTCWARKEAYIKARGEGLLLALDSFDVMAAPGDEARLIATRPDPSEAARWILHDLDVGPGYKAALAVEGAGWRLRTWNVPPLSVL